MKTEYRVRMERRARTGHRTAFVTFLMVNDSYLPGCLLVAQALREQQVAADLVCMATDQISGDAVRMLTRLYDRVVCVDAIYIPHTHAQKRQAVPYMFTRVNALRLGCDGDLNCAYEKVVVLDSDVLPMSNYESLLALPAPAGIINEDKYHFIEVDKQNRYVIPTDVYETGKWYLGRKECARHYARFPDFQLWYRKWRKAICDEYPDLAGCRCLWRLTRQINRLVLDGAKSRTE